MHPKKNSQIKVSPCKSLYKKTLSNKSLFFFYLLLIKLLVLCVQWSWQTIVMGFIFLVFLFTTRHIVRTISLYKNLSSSLNYNFSNYFYLATEQNKTKTLLGCSSCSINISYHFHSSSLLPQFKKSSHLSCKNSSLSLVILVIF